MVLAHGTDLSHRQGQAKQNSDITERHRGGRRRQAPEPRGDVLGSQREAQGDHSFPDSGAQRPPTKSFTYFCPRREVKDKNLGHEAGRARRDSPLF